MSFLTTSSRVLERAMTTLLAGCVAYRRSVLVTVGLITVAAAMQLPNLRLDPDVDSFVPLHHPIRVFWSDVEERFMLGGEVLIAIVADEDEPDGIFTPETLGLIAQLTDRVEALPWVIDSELSSLSRAEAIIGEDDSLTTSRFYQQIPTTQDEANAIRRAVFDNPVYLDRLVSRGGDIATVVFKVDREAMDSGGAYQALTAMTSELERPGLRILLAGEPMVEAIYGRQMAGDIARLIPLTLACVVVLLFACFPTLSARQLGWRAAIALTALLAFGFVSGRAAAWSDPVVALCMAMLSAPGVFAPAAVVVVTLVWTWGLQAALNEPVYVTAIIMPPILLAIGCADGIHIVERYREVRSRVADCDRAVVETMQGIWRPVILTSVTTAAGFCALATGDMTAYVSLGLFTATGIVAAMLLSLTLIPAVLASWPSERTSSGLAASSEQQLGWLERLADFVTASARPVAYCGGAIALVCFVGALRLQVDSSWVQSLAKGTPVREADQELRARHGGTTAIHVIVDSGEEDGMKNPALLRAMDTVLLELGKHEQVGDTRSLSEYVKRMHQALNNDDPAANTIPDSRELIAQVLLLYSMSGDPGEFDDTVDYGYREANLVAHLRSDRLKVMADVIETTDRLLDEHLRPLGVKATITGSAMMQHTISGLVFQGQVYSLAAATLFMFILLMGIYRSASYVFVCMVPPAFSGLATFGVMGASSITLGPTEAVIAAIALGIGIDYSLHLIARMRAEVSRGTTSSRAVRIAVATTGRGIFFNATVVCIGFLVLAFSESPRNIAFGFLIAGNMVTCCIAALVFVPALIELWFEDGDLLDNEESLEGSETNAAGVMQELGELAKVGDVADASRL